LVSWELESSCTLAHGYLGRKGARRGRRRKERRRSKRDGSVVRVHAEQALASDQHLDPARGPVLALHEGSDPLSLLERHALHRPALQKPLHLLHVEDVVVGSSLRYASSSLPKDDLSVLACPQCRCCVHEADEVDERTSVHELDGREAMDGERAQGAKDAEGGRQTCLVLVIDVANEDGEVGNWLSLDGDRQAAAVHGRRRAPSLSSMEAQMIDVDPEHILGEMSAFSILEVEVGKLRVGWVGWQAVEDNLSAAREGQGRRRGGM